MVSSEEEAEVEDEVEEEEGEEEEELDFRLPEEDSAGLEGRNGDQSRSLLRG